MAGAPTPKSDAILRASEPALGRNAPSRRLTQSLVEEDARGEKAIALAQSGIAIFMAMLHVFGLQQGMPDVHGWLAIALAALIASSAVRWWLASKPKLPTVKLDALSVIDVGIVLTAIWSYQFAFDHPAGGVLKAPAFLMLLLLVGVRALRFHPRPIVVAGVAAVAGWCLLIGSAAFNDGLHVVTRDYHHYLTSFSILPAAEVQRLVALSALTIVLALGAYGARRIIGRAAHVADYGEALEAARQHLQASMRAREQAEDALSALDRREADLVAQNDMFTTVLNRMSQGLCMFDQDQKLLVCNNRYLEMYGLSKDLGRPGTPFRKIVESRIQSGVYDGGDPTAYLDERLAAVREAVRHTRLHELSDGRIIAITHEPMEGGGWVATHDDVTRLRRIEARLSHLARHDALTDLPNRVQLRERLDELLQSLDDRNIVIVVFEIDRFKEINDTYGPSIGDVLLQGVAQRLTRRFDAIAMVARIGGDEFAVLQTLDDASGADALVKSVQTVLGPSFDIDDHPLAITVSAGVAVAPADGETPDELLKNADLALGRAKRDGPGNFRFFERELDERMRARSKLEQDMRLALREGQFELHFQPQLNLSRKEIAGFEALLRWRHPERGFISPTEFIPIAEDNGLIVPLGEWALRTACEEAARWPRPLRVAVNLSVAQFRSGHVRQQVISALGAAKLSPSRLELEITESVLMQEGTEVPAVLGRLQDLGIAIALDDFGTGFSSLGYLTRMRFDKIKIDKHFISSLGESPNSAFAILRSVVALSKSLGIKTVAEGVETKEQLELVRAEGCTEAQGFYIGHPMAGREVAAFLAGRSGKAQRVS